MGLLTPKEKVKVISRDQKGIPLTWGFKTGLSKPLEFNSESTARRKHKILSHED